MQKLLHIWIIIATIICSMWICRCRNSSHHIVRTQLLYAGLTGVGVSPSSPVDRVSSSVDMVRVGRAQPTSPLGSEGQE